MKRKLLSLVMAGAMVLSLAACGTNTTGNTGNTGAENTGAENTGVEPTATEIPADEEITLNMWCIATESDSNRHSYEAAIADMEEKDPNLTLN